MKQKLSILLLLLIVFVSQAQTKRPTWKLVYSDSKVDVKIRFYIIDDVCNTSTKVNSFEYKITGTPYSYNKYYSWELTYTDCNGNLIKEPQRVLIGGSNAMTGIKRSTDYTFRGSLVINKKAIAENLLSKIETNINNNDFETARDNLNKLIALKTKTNTAKIKTKINNKEIAYLLSKIKSELNKNNFDIATSDLEELKAKFPNYNTKKIEQQILIAHSTYYKNKIIDNIKNNEYTLAYNTIAELNNYNPKYKTDSLKNAVKNSAKKYYTQLIQNNISQNNFETAIINANYLINYVPTYNIDSLKQIIFFEADKYYTTEIAKYNINNSLNDRIKIINTSKIAISFLTPAKTDYKSKYEKIIQKVENKSTELDNEYKAQLSKLTMKFDYQKIYDICSNALNDFDVIYNYKKYKFYNQKKEYAYLYKNNLKRINNRINNLIDSKKFKDAITVFNKNIKDYDIEDLKPLIIKNAETYATLQVDNYNLKIAIELYTTLLEFTNDNKYQLLIDELNSKIKKIKTYKYVSIGACSAGILTGSYLLYKANDNYNKYKITEYDASNLHSKITSQTNFSYLAFGVATVGLVSTYIFSKKMRKINGEAEISTSNLKKIKYASIGVGAAGILTGSYLLYKANDNYNKYKNTEYNASDLHNKITTQTNLSYLAFGVGAIGLTSTIIFSKKINNIDMAIIPINNGLIFSMNIKINNK